MRFLQSIPGATSALLSRRERNLGCDFGAAPQSGGLDCVVHEHCDGQRTYAAGDGSDCTGNFGDVGMHVADQRAAFLAEDCEALRKIREETFRLLAASVMRLMPTSMTVAPGRMKSGVIMPGRPMAATTMSARWTTARRSRVLEWQMVTVALACVSRSAIGLPTMSLRPSTTAFAPSSVMLLVFENFHYTGGCASDESGAACYQVADVKWVEAVHIFCRVHRV